MPSVPSTPTNTVLLYCRAPFTHLLHCGTCVIPSYSRYCTYCTAATPAMRASAAAVRSAIAPRQICARVDTPTRSAAARGRPQSRQRGRSPCSTSQGRLPSYKIDSLAPDGDRQRTFTTHSSLLSSASLAHCLEVPSATRDRCT